MYIKDVHVMMEGRYIRYNDGRNNIKDTIVERMNVHVYQKYMYNDGRNI